MSSPITDKSLSRAHRTLCRASYFEAVAVLRSRKREALRQTALNRRRRPGRGHIKAAVEAALATLAREIGDRDHALASRMARKRRSAA